MTQNSEQSLQSDDNKRLVENFFSLSILQAVNFILPLLTIPYLVRVLGPEHFGLLAFASAMVSYFIIITDYGFNLSATQQISTHRNDKEKLVNIFSAVMVVKMMLLVLCFFLITFIVFGFEKFKNDWQVYYLSFGVVIGQVLFPVWLFQGLEKMKYIAYLNVLAKSIFTIPIFIFVQNQSDYLLVPALTSGGFITAGVMSLFIAGRELGIRFRLPKVSSLKECLIDGWHVFFSKMSTGIYTVSTTFILGLFASNTIVGYYSAAEKIVKAVQSLYAPFSQAIYPYINKRINESVESSITLIKKVTYVLGGIMFIFSLALFILAKPIVLLIMGQQYSQSILIVQIMAFLPFIIVLSNIFGIQIMLNFGYKKAFSNILAMGAFIGILLSLILVPIYHHVGSAITVLIVEVIVTINMLVYLRRVGIFSAGSKMLR